MARIQYARMFVGMTMAVAFLSGAVACDSAAYLDQPKGDSSSASTRIVAALPEGYVYNGAERALMAPNGVNALAAPSYVTEVALRVTGPDIEPRIILVPLDTLAVVVSVTFGERTFTLGVKTRNGDIFTGTKTVTIDAGTASEVVIPLEVNGPPVVDRIDLSNTNPKVGDTLILSAFATDPDPDDTLTYAWTGTAPDGSVNRAAGQTVSFTIPPIAGTYTATVTVDDGKGGTASKSGTVTIAYAKPVIRGVIMNPTTPYDGQSLTVSLDLFQTLPTYRYFWDVTLPNGNKWTSQQATLSSTSITGGKYSFRVTVSDDQGNSTVYNGSFIVNCAQVTGTPTVTATKSSTINGRIDVTWVAVPNAKSYYAKVFSGGALQRTDTGLTGTTKAMVEPVGQMRGYAVGGVDCLGKQGPASATTTEVQTGGIHQPVNLGQSGSTTGSTVVYWTSDSGAVTPAQTPSNYRMKVVNNTTKASVIVNNTLSAATCPGGAPWNGGGMCGSYVHTCTSGTSYTYSVQEYYLTFLSESSAAFTFTCP